MTSTISIHELTHKLPGDALHCCLEDQRTQGPDKRTHVTRKRHMGRGIQIVSDPLTIFKEVQPVDASMEFGTPGSSSWGMIEPVAVIAKTCLQLVVQHYLCTRLAVKVVVGEIAPCGPCFPSSHARERLEHQRHRLLFSSWLEETGVCTGALPVTAF